MDTRLNGTITTLRIAIGLMATLAGLDKFFNLLANWETYVAPLAQQLLPFSTATLMAVVGVVLHFAIATISVCRSDKNICAPFRSAFVFKESERRRNAYLSAASFRRRIWW